MIYKSPKRCGTGEQETLNKLLGSQPAHPNAIRPNYT
jgi:hypothetical protein